MTELSFSLKLNSFIQVDAGQALGSETLFDRWSFSNIWFFFFLIWVWNYIFQQKCFYPTCSFSQSRNYSKNYDYWLDSTIKVRIKEHTSNEGSSNDVVCSLPTVPSKINMGALPIPSITLLACVITTREREQIVKNMITSRNGIRDERKQTQ